MKFKKGENYYLRIVKNEPVRYGRNGVISETKEYKYNSKFECISIGKKIHFYSSELGKDFYLTKDEAIKAFNEYEYSKQGS